MPRILVILAFVLVAPIAPMLGVVIWQLNDLQLDGDLVLGHTGMTEWYLCKQANEPGIRC